MGRRTLEPGRYATQRGAWAQVTGTLGVSARGLRRANAGSALLFLAHGVVSTGYRFLRRFLRSRKLECQSCAEDFLGASGPDSD